MGSFAPTTSAPLAQRIFPAVRKNSALQGLAKQQTAALTASVNRVNYANQTDVRRALAPPTTATVLRAMGQRPFAAQAFAKTAAARKQPVPESRSVTLPTFARPAPRETTLCVSNATAQPASVRGVPVRKVLVQRTQLVVGAPFVKTQCARRVAAVRETLVAKHAMATTICASSVVALLQTVEQITSAATANFVSPTCAPLAQT